MASIPEINLSMSVLPTLDQIQEEIGKWSYGNFGHNESKITGEFLYSQNALNGLVEEVGELLGATIKHHQGRSGYGPTDEGRKKYTKDRTDAVADILIFLLDYCHREGISAYDSLLKTWTNIVSKRRADLPDAWLRYSHLSEEVEVAPTNMAGDIIDRVTVLHGNETSVPISQTGQGWAEPVEAPEVSTSVPQEGVTLSTAEATQVTLLLDGLLALVEGQPYGKMAPRVAAFKKLLKGE